MSVLRAEMLLPVPLLLTVRRSRRPETMQPSELPPGGVGQPSDSEPPPQRGAAEPLPRMWSYVYRA